MGRLPCRSRPLISWPEFRLFVGENKSVQQQIKSAYDKKEDDLVSLAAEYGYEFTEHEGRLELPLSKPVGSGNYLSILRCNRRLSIFSPSIEITV